MAPAALASSSGLQRRDVEPEVGQEVLRLRMVRHHQDPLRPERDAVEADVLAGRGRLWEEGDAVAGGAQRLHHRQGRAARLGGGEVAVEDAHQADEGRVLLAMIEEEVRKLGGIRLCLEAELHNPRATHLYATSGYREHERRLLSKVLV